MFGLGYCLGRLSGRFLLWVCTGLRHPEWVAPSDRSTTLFSPRLPFLALTATSTSSRIRFSPSAKRTRSAATSLPRWCACECEKHRAALNSALSRRRVSCTGRVDVARAGALQLRLHFSRRHNPLIPQGAHAHLRALPLAIRLAFPRLACFATTRVMCRGLRPRNAHA